MSMSGYELLLRIILILLLTTAGLMVWLQYNTWRHRVFLRRKAELDQCGFEPMMLQFEDGLGMMAIHGVCSWRTLWRWYWVSCCKVQSYDGKITKKTHTPRRRLATEAAHDAFGVLASFHWDEQVGNRNPSFLPWGDTA